MRLLGPDLILSATDLSNFLSCRHRTALEMAEAHDGRQRPKWDDPLLQILFQRGLDHEKAYVESLRAKRLTVADLREAKTQEGAVAGTLEHMRSGVDVIVQGSLADGRWFGKTDVLQRVDKPSALGAWSYEVTDTKLARETRAGTILQLGLYSEMLGTAQGAAPEYFHVVTPDPEVPRQSYRIDDYAAYFRLVRSQMEEIVAQEDDVVAAAYDPEPVDHCDICPWSTGCNRKRHADDHLSIVAGISRLQRRELESRGTTTLTALAQMPLPLEFKPNRGSAETYVTVREQARVQFESRGKTPPVHELRPFVEGEGLSRLPEPSPGDMFLDLEGDSFAREGGREYLFGVVTLDPAGAPVYRAFWALADHEERQAFETLMDLIGEAWTAHPGMHVYHYAPYEPSAFKRLMGRYATRGDELDRLLRAGRFVDLYGVVRQGLRGGIERYSIKNLEVFYGFERSVPLERASRSLLVMEQALELNRPDTVPQEVRDLVQGYNEDDCVSALRLRDWLEQLRAELEAPGTTVPRPTPKQEEAKVDERAQRVEALRKQLLQGIPDTRDELSEEQHARWLLAYLLDWHHREDNASSWEYFRLKELPEEDLFDEPQAVAGLEFVERVTVVAHKKTGKPTGSVVDRYRYPPQEMEVRPKDELKLRDGKTLGDVDGVDRTARTIEVTKGPAQAENHPTSAFAHNYVPTGVLEKALFAIGESIAKSGVVSADQGQPNPVAGHLLLAAPPRLRSGRFAPHPDETAVDFAVRVVKDLDHTVLAVQGPPGSGKTFSGGEMICALVDQGQKVGVTATSGKVIDNLLKAVAKAAKKKGVDARLAHKSERVDDASDGDALPIAALGSNAEALAALQSGGSNVLGGTAWVWARPEFASSVDVLFVDEAAQISLANVLAVSGAAKSIVLLGDPQQLDQPQKGSHPEGVDASALGHILGDHRIMPADRGIFLPITWRLAPSICSFTSEVFYESRLTSKPGLERQCLTGVGEYDGSGVRLIEVDHDGNRNSSMEEIEKVADLVALFTAPGAQWTNDKGEAAQMTPKDVLVIAPYNAQVTRLTERLEPSGVRVGTVDKFQGQEAPVVIYSMATSRPEDAPRGMEFLYSLNRLNVATSRARCLSIVVASPRLFEPECRTPRQMKLANALCRYRELAITAKTGALS